MKDISWKETKTVMGMTSGQWSKPPQCLLIPPKLSDATRGGSRIRRGRQPKRGVPTYDFAKVKKKIEKILGRRGGRDPGEPLLDPPLATLLDHLLRVFVLTILILIAAVICRINKIKLRKKDNSIPLEGILFIAETFEALDVNFVMLEMSGCYLRKSRVTSLSTLRTNLIK